MMDDGEPEIMEGSKVDDSETQEVSNESDVLTEEPLENEDDQLKKIAEEETTIEEGKAESADMKSKVFNAVKASAATAAKVTGDVIHKVESAVHRDSSQEDLKNMQDKSVNSDDSMEDEKAGGHEANPDAPVERRPSAASKILLAASAASKTVVTSAKTAAKVTGDVISKATESVRRPADKKADDSVLAVGDEMDGYCEQCEGKILPCKVLECVQEEGEPDLYIVEFNLLDLELGDSNGIQATLLRKQIFSRPIEAVEKEAEKTCEGEGATEELPPKDTQKLWSSVRTFTGAVGGFSSRAWANTTEAVSKVAKKAPAESSETAPAGSSSEPAIAIESVASTDEGAEEGSFEGAAAEGQEGVEKGEEKGEAETTAEQDASRDRSESVSNKLFSSVRRMSEALSESASAAYKAAEPVAVSTAAKVSQGAQSAWMSTVEKVKAVTAKKPVDGEGSVEGEGAEVNSTGADVGGSVATDISSVDGDGTASTTDIDNGETAESGETAAAAASAAVEEEEEGEGVQTEEEAATEDVKVEEEETAGADDVQGAEEVPETTQQEQQEQEGEEQDGANEKSVDDEGEGDAEVTETADGDDVDGDVDATADEGEEAEGGEARSGAGKKKKKKKGKK